MKPSDYTVSFTVDESPEEVFAAVNNVRGWWSGNIEGSTAKLGAVFTYRYKDLHDTTQEIAEWVPGEKVVWHVLKAHINFVKNKTEWEGTDIVFEVASKGNQTELRFTHVGLVPAIECYGKCSGAWRFFINESLRSLITSGNGDPVTGKEA
jgi:Activator of Hsp90 ATPase homolog 1-like protein